MTMIRQSAPAIFTPQCEGIHPIALIFDRYREIRRAGSHPSNSRDSMVYTSNATGIRRIAVLGNHTPRQCGIATFTTDLAHAVLDELPELECKVLAMNDAGKTYAYPTGVGFEIAEGDLSSYVRAREFVNASDVQVLSIQHEYGIYGGEAGSHLLALLSGLHMPIVATLHTILSEPDPAQRTVMDELIRLAERLVVMSVRGAELLRTVHGAPSCKIDLIPHGVPNTPSTFSTKHAVGVEGKRVLLTFGLLAPDKGIECVVEALPAVLARFPDTVYIVLGVTHPHVKQQHGEGYRLSLERRAEELGVASSVIFHNRFVSQAELADFIAAADIYITPYHKPEQITSGSLAYAVGSGKAAISTPYLYARELLSDGRGILVPWRDPAAIAREVIGLFSDPAGLLRMRERAAQYGSDMAWPAVARRYLSCFAQALTEHGARPCAVNPARTGSVGRSAERPGAGASV